MKLSPLGDRAVVVALGSGLDPLALPRVRVLAEALGRGRLPGVVDVVPAFATVTVFYEPECIGSYAKLCAAIENCAARADASMPAHEARRIEIPVCYEREFGPDLGDVAAHSGLVPNRVVELHSGADYLVHGVGFAPGFGYLGGLPEEICTPRRASPRIQVPAGAVGIGGEQTGVYPFPTPGGWNLVGRTPLKMFDAAREEPALLQVGDRVKFRVISAKDFAAWK